MDLSGKRVLVTGGAGQIGTHMTAVLAADNEVVSVDDCSKGRREWVPDHPNVEFHEVDLTDEAAVADVVTADLDLVVHLAALSDVNRGDHRTVFEANNQMTYNLLERMADVGVDRFAFASTSAVYGEAPRPTPEDHAPLEPISTYGACKLAEEALLSVYAHSHGFQVWAFRFANVVGPHQRNTVVPDFIEKLLEDPETLTILGDGRQEKAYIHVSDTVDGMRHVLAEADDAFNLYNLGTETTIPVTRIADIVSDVVGVDPDYEFTGGERGWMGDIPRMRLDIEQAMGLGWTPALESADAVRRAAEELLPELQVE